MIHAVVVFEVYRQFNVIRLLFCVDDAAAAAAVAAT